MPTYTYTARDSTGGVFSGAMEASSRRVLRANLRKMNFVPISIGRRPGRGGGWRTGIPSGDLLVFVRQLGALYEGGVPLITSLRSIQKDTVNPALRDVVRDVADQLEAGATLRGAFGRHQAVFSEFFLGMIEAGEAAGMLDQALTQAATHIEAQAELKQKVISAFAYPLVVCVLCSMVVTFIVVFVVPVFATAYAKGGILLPLPTRVLMWLSDTARHYWWAGLAAVAAAVFAYYRLRLSAARRWFDVVKVSLPLFGPLNRKVAVARFVRTFGLLSQNGVSLMSALDVAEKVANNYLISLAAADIRHAVRGGGNFSGPMAAHTIFPSMVLQLASTGESTGRMPAMLLRAADHLDREIDRTIKRLLTVLEPLLTVVLAAVVGGVLMAVYLPMFDIMKMTQ